MSKRAAFYEAYRDDRTLLVDDIEPHFNGCGLKCRAGWTALKKRLTHEDERVWGLALDQIAGMIPEGDDA